MALYRQQLCRLHVYIIVKAGRRPEMSGLRFAFCVAIPENFSCAIRVIPFVYTNALDSHVDPGTRIRWPLRIPQPRPAGQTLLVLGISILVLGEVGIRVFALI